MTVGDALGNTGIVLLFPTIALYIFGGMRISEEPFNDPDKLGRVLVALAVGLSAVDFTLWITAIWSAVK